MPSIVEYRKVIYGNYFSNQVNKSASDYKHLLQQQSRHLQKEILPLLPTDKNAKIIDLGCGYGSFVYTARQAGYTNISGIDLSEEQVKVADELGIEGVKLGDIADFLSEEQSFDCIVGLDIIEHFTKNELVDFLTSVRKKLNSNGKVIFRTPNMDAPNGSLYSYGDYSHECLLNKNSAKQVLLSTGYNGIKVNSGLIYIQNPVKELFRKVIWALVTFKLKLVLFASGRTWKEVVFGPNLLIEANK